MKQVFMRHVKSPKTVADCCYALWFVYKTSKRTVIWLPLTWFDVKLFSFPMCKYFSACPALVYPFFQMLCMCADLSWHMIQALTVSPKEVLWSSVATAFFRQNWKTVITNNYVWCRCDFAVISVFWSPLVFVYTILTFLGTCSFTSAVNVILFC